MDASGVLDALTEVPDIVVDEVAVSALVVMKFVENVVDRVVVGATPAVVLEISTVSDGRVVEVTDLDVVGIQDEVLAVALRVQLSVVLVAEAVVVASFVELLVAVLVLDALAVVVVALVVWVDVSNVSVNVELPVVEVADKLLVIVVIEMLVVAVDDVRFELPVVDSVRDTVVVAVLDVVAEVVKVWLQRFLAVVELVSFCGSVMLISVRLVPAAKVL